MVVRIFVEPEETLSRIPKSAADVHHPNTCPIRDVGDVRGGTLWRLGHHVDLRNWLKEEETNWLPGRTGRG